MSGNIYCARCRATVPASDASFSDDGSLVCRSCAGMVAARQADYAIQNHQYQQQSNSNWLQVRLIILGVKLVILFFACVIFAIARS